MNSYTCGECLENLCAGWHFTATDYRRARQSMSNPIDVPQSALLGSVHAERRHIPAQHGARTMMDVLMLAIAAGLFAAGIGYAYVCERL